MSMNEIDYRLETLAEQLNEIAEDLGLTEELFEAALLDLNYLWDNNPSAASNFWDIAADVNEDNFEEFNDLAIACIESVLVEMEAKKV